jgi:small-conductance mechanosensitive channel
MLDTLLLAVNEWLIWVRVPQFWWQIVCIVVAATGAFLINRWVQRLLQVYGEGDSGFRHIAVRSLKRLLWPLSTLALLLPAKAILDWYELSTQLLGVAVSILLALALIRLSVYILRKAFTASPILKSSESFLATVIWVGVVLHLLGWLPAVLELLRGVGLTVGESRISLLDAMQLVLMVVLAFTLALWLSGVLSNWLKSSRHVSPGMQVGFSKFIRFLLLALAFLIALNVAGINLSSLAIFGGALGVGLGFGLQRITSNFISGFILVMDRSIKPGDVITVGDQFGWVEALNARYVVVRNREGVDTLIPNENLITSEVINWSYSDRNVRVTLNVQVSYGDDPEQALELILGCAFASPRVLKEPAPTALLKKFADSGIELQLLVWIGDPENGSSMLCSDIYRAIWRAFKDAGITIPYPQRDLHIKSGLPALLARAPD